MQFMTVLVGVAATLFATGDSRAVPRNLTLSCGSSRSKLTIMSNSTLPLNGTGSFCNSTLLLNGTASSSSSTLPLNGATSIGNSTTPLNGTTSSANSTLPLNSTTPIAKGNPFSQPGLNSIVPAGKQLVITWEPTTNGTITLILLKGPSSNALPQYPIASKIPNTGTHTWNVSSALPPSPPNAPSQGYGIKLLVDATSQIQYTPQFGIFNPSPDFTSK